MTQFPGRAVHKYIFWALGTRQTHHNTRRSKWQRLCVCAPLYVHAIKKIKSIHAHHQSYTRRAMIMMLGVAFTFTCWEYLSVCTWCDVMFTCAWGSKVCQTSEHLPQKDKQRCWNGGGAKHGHHTTLKERTKEKIKEI